MFVHTWAPFTAFYNALRCQTCQRKKVSFHTEQSPFLFFFKKRNTPLHSQNLSTEGHTWWVKSEILSSRKREELTAWVPLAWCNSLCVGRSSLPQWRRHWVITDRKPEESRNYKMRWGWDRHEWTSWQRCSFGGFIQISSSSAEQYSKRNPEWCKHLWFSWYIFVYDSLQPKGHGTWKITWKKLLLFCTDLI